MSLNYIHLAFVQNLRGFTGIVFELCLSNLCRWDESKTDRDELSSYDAMLAAQDFTQLYKLRRPKSMYFQAHRFRKLIWCTSELMYI